MTKGTYDWSVCLLSLMEWSLELGPIPAPHLPYGGATAPMLGEAEILASSPQPPP